MENDMQTTVDIPGLTGLEEIKQELSTEIFTYDPEVVKLINALEENSAIKRNETKLSSYKEKWGPKVIIWEYKKAVLEFNNQLYLVTSWYFDEGNGSKAITNIDRFDTKDETPISPKEIQSLLEHAGKFVDKHAYQKTPVPSAEYDYPINFIPHM
jgi:gamma-glutamylcyclotransferase (GGCT)/AIG2-like uncharacterized protein YtfP